MSIMHHLARTIPVRCLKSGWDISQTAQVLRKQCLNYACKHSLAFLDAQAHSMTIKLLPGYCTRLGAAAAKQVIWSGLL